MTFVIAHMCVADIDEVMIPCVYIHVIERNPHV